MRMFDDLYGQNRLKGNPQPDTPFEETPVEKTPEIASKDPEDFSEWPSSMQKPEIEELQNMLKGGSHIVDVVNKIYSPDKLKADRERQEKRDKSSRKLAALSDLVSGIGGLITAASGGIVNKRDKSYSGVTNARAEQLRQEHEAKLQRYNDSYMSAYQGDLNRNDQTRHAAINRIAQSRAQYLEQKRYNEQEAYRAGNDAYNRGINERNFEYQTNQDKLNNEFRNKGLAQQYALTNMREEAKRSRTVANRGFKTPEGHVYEDSMGAKYLVPKNEEGTFVGKAYPALVTIIEGENQKDKKFDLKKMEILNNGVTSLDKKREILMELGSKYGVYDKLIQYYAIPYESPAQKSRSQQTGSDNIQQGVNLNLW